MEPKLKLINEKTDLSDIVIFDHDTVINSTLDPDNNVPIKVCKIPGYYHCIGGRHGNNDLYSFPRDVKVPKYRDLTPFDGELTNFGFDISPKNYLGKYGVESYYYVRITRNFKTFYEFSVNDFGYGVAKAQVLIEEMKELPINIWKIDFDKSMIGRKVTWKGEPAIISYYCDGQACIILDADIINCSSPISKHFNYDTYSGWNVKVEIFDKNIGWFL